MATTTITYKFYVAGVLTDADTSVALSDVTAAYGVKRQDNDAVVVADDTAMTNIGTGTYSHTFTDPALGLTYDFAVEAIHNGGTYRLTGSKAGSSTSSGLRVPDAIKSRIERAPDIDTIDLVSGGYIDEMIDTTIGLIMGKCQLDEFPELSQGTSVSASGASEDITGLATDTFFVSVDGSTFLEATVLLPGNDTGAEIAAAMQVAIRAVDTGVTGANWIWDNVTVTWDDTATQYTVTSPSFGPASSALISFAVDEYHVAQALKLGPSWGGVERIGTDQDETLDRIASQMVINAYRAIKLAPEAYDSLANRATLLAMQFQRDNDWVKKLLLGKRRIRI